MKEKAIRKINGMGKFSAVLTKIAKIIVGIAIFVTLAGVIATSLIPSDLVIVNWSGEAQVELNLDAIKQISDSDIKSAVDSIKNNQGSVSVDGKQYAITKVTKDGKAVEIKAGAESPDSITMESVRNVLACALVYLLLMRITLGCIGRLSKALKTCTSPFDENVIKKLNWFAVSLLPWTIVDSLMSSVTSYFLYGNSSLNVDVNVGMLMVVFAIWGLIYIFKYGALLQEEADETL